MDCLSFSMLPVCLFIECRYYVSIHKLNRKTSTDGLFVECSNRLNILRIRQNWLHFIFSNFYIFITTLLLNVSNIDFGAPSVNFASEIVNSTSLICSSIAGRLHF